MNNEPTVDLSTYDRGDYDPGPWGLRAAWYGLSLFFIDSPIPWPQIFKVGLLRFLGATIGDGVVIKPRVRIKYPWNLHIGGHTWVGESVWIDNLAPVQIGSHCCLSQGACLMTGNHDRTSPSFDLRLTPIEIADGAWIGAKALLCPGVQVETHAILNAGAVAKGTLEAHGIYEGNPAERVGTRELRSGDS